MTKKEKKAKQKLWRKVCRTQERKMKKWLKLRSQFLAENFGFYD